jgi:hypothetical protein
MHAKGGFYDEQAEMGIYARIEKGGGWIAGQQQVLTIGSGIGAMQRDCHIARTQR